jgi:hypothetical protein
MTRDEAKKLLPIIKAYGEGKVIEWKHPGGEWSSSDTIDQDDVFFEVPSNQLRIKPETKKVPMTYEDFKGMPIVWVRFYSIAHFCEPNDEYLVTRFNDLGFFTTKSQIITEYKESFESRIEWSTDRVNWCKFEKEDIE